MFETVTLWTAQKWGGAGVIDTIIKIFSFHRPDAQRIK